MIIWMLVTSDKYELPIMWGESARELADKIGVPRNYIHSAISNAKKQHQRCKYVKVEVEDDD